MYGLPAGENFAFLVGLALDQVCIGRHEMILNFEADTSINVEGNLGVESPEGRELVQDDLRQAVADVALLLAKRVTNVIPRPEGTLTLTFDSGSRLNIYDSSERYESYQIRHGSARHGT